MIEYSDEQDGIILLTRNFLPLTIEKLELFMPYNKSSIKEDFSV